MQRALDWRAAHGGTGRPKGRVLASRQCWSVEDVICTSGPRDRRFEEQHRHVSIAIVAAGSFQYRSTPGSELMTPGSILLGNAGQFFECGHDHGEGDRCIAFHYDADYFEKLAAAAGASGVEVGLRVVRLPPLRALSALVARACAGLVDGEAVAWEELSVQLATRTAQLVAGVAPDRSDPPQAALARVTRIARTIEQDPGGGLALDTLAREAGLSPFHFLRTFQRVTGLTPHQYVLRTRLRQAAMRLAVERDKVIDVAFGCGFGDVSNFNRAFRMEFGVSPRVYRLHALRRS
ncbi:MAG: helix-turn-helix transcriptional regulator [Longimicrobiales bacterium]